MPELDYTKVGPSTGINQRPGYPPCPICQLPMDPAAAPHHPSHDLPKSEVQR